MTLQATLIAVLVALTAGFGSGWRVHAWKAQAAQEAAIAQGITDAAIQMQKDTETALLAAQAQDKVRVVYRTLKAEVNHAVITDCSPSTEFVRLWNRASEAATQGKASGVDGGVSRSGDAPR